MPKEEESVVALESLDEEAWSKIESLTQQIIDAKIYRDNIVRAAVAAFCVYLSSTDTSLIVEADQPAPKRKKGLH